jgi:hypothetical protein
MSVVDSSSLGATEMLLLHVSRIAKSIGIISVELVVFQCFSVDGRCSDNTEMLTLSSLEMAESVGRVSVELAFFLY